MTGDTVSALFNIGKRKIIDILSDPMENWDMLHIFSCKTSTQSNVAKVGEHLLLKLYGSKCTTGGLDKQRHISYMRRVSRTSLTSAEFQLASLPPTSASARFHCLRAYLTIQQWLGNDDICPTDWGWELVDGKLLPIPTDQAPAPDRVLKIVSCGCKVGCGKRCKCVRAGLFCSPMCSSCTGLTCKNCTIPQQQDDN